MNYQQLSEGRRYQTSALLERGISVSEIASAIDLQYIGSLNAAAKAVITAQAKLRGTIN